MNGNRSLGFAVFAGEMRRLTRDRRAVLLAVVLPMVAFPLLFLFSGKLGDLAEESLASREVTIALDLRALDPADARAIHAGLGDVDLLVTTEAIEVDALPGRDAARGLLGTTRHLLAIARPAEDPDEDPRPVLHLFHDTDELPEEAEDRMRAVLRDVRAEVSEARLVAAVGADPGAPFQTEAVDVASPEDAAGRGLGSLLPLLAVLVLISGGSFAALDAFAGEREAGTLETLLVQPVPSGAVARGKYGAVLLTGVVAFAGNALSLFGCLVFDLGSMPSLPADTDWSLAGGRLAFGCLLFLPTAAMICAVLCLLSARARSFRQGQLATVPLSLLVVALAAPAMQPTADLGLLAALVPITGASLALRDAVAGVFAPGAQVAVAVASCGWAALAIGQLRRTLDAERVLASGDAEEEGSTRRVQSRTALRWGFVAVLVVYVGGGRLQAVDPMIGLLLTLWVLGLGLAFVAARGTARRAGETLAETLGLGTPRVTHVAGAACLGLGLSTFAGMLFEWQARMLPMPRRLGEMESLFAFAEELSPFALVLLLAVSPGICEELLFRGALLSGLRRDLRPWAVIAWQALLFGAVHASVYRFLPTAILGGVLAAVTLRARSVWPAIVMHSVYNTAVVLQGIVGVEWLGSPWLGVLVVPGVVLVAVRVGRGSL